MLWIIFGGVMGSGVGGVITRVIGGKILSGIIGGGIIGLIFGGVMHARDHENQELQAQAQELQIRLQIERHQLQGLLNAVNVIINNRENLRCVINELNQHILIEAERGETLSEKMRELERKRAAKQRLLQESDQRIAEFVQQIDLNAGDRIVSATCNEVHKQDHVCKMAQQKEKAYNAGILDRVDSLPSIAANRYQLLAGIAEEKMHKEEVQKDTSILSKSH